MAEWILTSASNITNIHWDIFNNTISLKSFKTIPLKRETSETKIEFWMIIGKNVN